MVRVTISHHHHCNTCDTDCKCLELNNLQQLDSYDVFVKFCFLTDKFLGCIYYAGRKINTIYTIPLEVTMDDFVFLTVGKLYFEIMRLQQVVDSQNKLISDLEAKIQQTPLSENPKRG